MMPDAATFLTDIPPLDLTGFDEQAGPWAGVRAYAGAEPKSFDLPRLLGAQGTVAVWVRLDAPIVNGPDVETDGGTILEFPGFAKLNLWWYSGYGGIVWETADGMPNLPVEVPGLPGPQWLHLCYTWDAASGRLDGAINGTPIRLPGTYDEPWTPGRAETVQVNASRWAVAGLTVTDRLLERDAILAGVPSIYRGAMDHTLGAQALGALDAAAWRGEQLLEIPLDDPAQIDGWRMEGPGEVSFHDGWMRMRSTTPDAPGKDGHIVHWCDRDLPADFLLEFDCRIRSPHGLNIIFFAAKGCNGEDVLDPGLNERTGVFGHYTMNDIHCYHTSYYASAPGGGAGRSTSNLRKNRGFYLVDNGPIGIPPGTKDVQRVALLKRGGLIRLGVNGRRVIDWFDDGRQYGPVLGGGKFALRQMKWTEAEYRNLTVHGLKESSA